MAYALKDKHQYRVGRPTSKMWNSSNDGSSLDTIQLHICIFCYFSVLLSCIYVENGESDESGWNTGTRHDLPYSLAIQGVWANDGMLNTAANEVAGRKNIVMIAILFIEVLSLLISMAIVCDCLAIFGGVGLRCLLQRGAGASLPH